MILEVDQTGLQVGDVVKDYTQSGNWAGSVSSYTISEIRNSMALDAKRVALFDLTTPRSFRVERAMVEEVVIEVVIEVDPSELQVGDAVTHYLPLEAVRWIPAIRTESGVITGISGGRTFDKEGEVWDLTKKRRYRVLRPAFLKLMGGDILPGDVIVDFLRPSGSWQGVGYSLVHWTVEQIEGDVIRFAEGGIERISTGLLYKVKRAGVVKKQDGRWNGKCRCGSNIYTGFREVEHEGQTCSVQ